MFIELGACRIVNARERLGLDDAVRNEEVDDHRHFVLHRQSIRPQVDLRAVRCLVGIVDTGEVLDRAGTRLFV